MTSPILASAATGPSAWTNLTFSMTLIGVAAVVFLFAAVPVVIARRRRLRATQTIAVLTVLWGILIAADVGYGINRMETDDARTDEMLRSGYLEPAATPQTPLWPWMALAPGFVFYAGVVGLAGTLRN